MPGTTPVSTPAAAVRAAGWWGRAIAVPGLAALNQGRNAGVSSVSCPSPGSCAAGGFFRDGGGHQQGFVAVEGNGRWGQAVEVPGLAALNQGRNGEVLSVSCASAGYCAAGGYYGNHGNNPYDVTSGRGFVAVERNGRWGRAVEVPGLAALSKGGNAQVSSVSCAPAGSCAAGGAYTDGNGDQQGFVAGETNGVWLQAVEVPGLAALSKGGNPDVPVGVSSVSCASPGSCAAGGDYYTDASGKHAFVVSEVNGSWGTARQVAANLGRGAAVNTVSCAPAGNCSAGGAYDYGGYNAPFVVSEKNGVWGQAIDVPGLVTRDAWISSVSCASAGNCGAGGGYDGAGSGGFVVSEKNGVWGKGIKVPGPDGLPADVGSVSCAPAGSCVAGGSYPEAGRHISIEGFVT